MNEDEREAMAVAAEVAAPTDAPRQYRDPDAHVMAVELATLTETVMWLARTQHDRNNREDMRRDDRRIGYLIVGGSAVMFAICMVAFEPMAALFGAALGASLTIVMWRLSASER